MKYFRYENRWNMTGHCLPDEIAVNRIRRKDAEIDREKQEEERL